ncbi:MAG: hypothetical protein H7A45_14365 [Verrucomicrobiales bacterium]|nr:hypothetical protein [Verrucomicrobiales bacterium]MCP5526364.1 hypothetical protein [Verrucomicrobiales bacterium]
MTEPVRDPAENAVPRRWRNRLDRLTRRWSIALAMAAGVDDPGLAEPVHAILQRYALALRRALHGAAHPPSAGEPRMLEFPQENADRMARRDATDSTNRTTQPRHLPPSPALWLALGVNDEAIVPTDAAEPARLLARFCALTGVSPDHIGGQGAHLAGIAFYWAVFARVAGARDLSHERATALLRELRECRERLAAFVSESAPGLRANATSSGKSRPAIRAPGPPDAKP